MQFFTSFILGFLFVFNHHTAKCDVTNPVLPDDKTPYLIRQISFLGNKILDRKALSRVFGVDAGKPYH
ncbi:MAG: hypothetical protein OXT74_03495, partial [Candidatus Poribacteria bacterium]|nr:hypothetical protein [Candidatus Poribacteria bacterium]